MSPGVQRELPLYAQIVAHYRDLIMRGELKDGERLPSTRQLALDWGVVLATASKAVGALKSEGLVRTEPGGSGGTRVSTAQLSHSPNDRMTAVTRWGKIYPANEHARIVSAEVVEAPEHVAEAMDVAVGSAVIRRHRVTYRDDTPVSASTSWFHGSLAEVAPTLLERVRIQGGTPGYIAAQTGQRLARSRDQVTAGVADATVAAELGIPEGSAVHIGRNWVLDADGGVIEFGEYATIPGRWSTYERDLTAG